MNGRETRESVHKSVEAGDPASTFDPGNRKLKQTPKLHPMCYELDINQKERRQHSNRGEGR
jgi:hypothetical protein